MTALIPLLSSLSSLLFTLAVLDQFRERRRPYQLVWMAGRFTCYDSETRGLSNARLKEMAAITGGERGTKCR